jgi:VWFA-related protein
MTPRPKRLAQILMLLAWWSLLPDTLWAQDRGFKGIVKQIETQYRVKKKRIPMLGLANFMVKIIHPAGIKDFKVAIFENRNFTRDANDRMLESIVRAALARDWQPTVRTRMNASQEQFYLYTQASGKDIKLVAVTVEPRRTIVLEAKANPEAVAKFMEKPEIFGKSLAGSFSGGFSVAGLGSGSSGIGSGSRDSGDQALASLGGQRIDPSAPARTQAADADSAARPALRARAEGESDPATPPVTSEAQPGATSAPKEPLPSERGILRMETRLVNLNVKVMDRGSRPISDLKPEDFTVYEDGIKQEIAFFEPVSAPVNLILLLDLSGSTREKRKVMAEAAKKFIDALNPDDRVALAAFTREFYLLADFTSDRKLLKKQVDMIKKIQGGTAFYDAMWTALDVLAQFQASRKAIVVLTDGEDESLLSGERRAPLHAFDELLVRVSEEDATIYPIYLSSGPHRPININISGNQTVTSIGDQIRASINNSLLRPREIARAQLEALAEQSAGMLFQADHERDLEGVYQRVAAELHLFYSLAYDPQNEQRNGKFRKVQVEVKREGAMARTRRGYYAK